MERTGHIQANTATALLIVGAVALAVDPAAWLLRSWTDPGYGSYGWMVFAASLALFIRSWSSPLRDPVPVPGSPFVLLIGTAAIRAVGQVLDIDTISALALGVDVYALARLARLDRRAWAVSPVGLAALFLCSLPIERLAQRSLGQGLQDISADGACAILTAIFGDVSCSGVQITLNGTSVMVDLPCAGIGGLTLLLIALIFVACLTRPSALRIVAAFATALATALIANMARVALLTIGAAHGEATLGIDPLAEPWHSAIGLLTLGIAALPAIAILTNARERRPTGIGAQRRIPLPLAGVFAAAAGIILILPSRPLDASTTPLPVTLPLQIEGHTAQVQPLSPQETRYFATYGGGAAKALYGPMGLLVSRTNAPLRHLHDAQDCLRGLGFAVQFIGTANSPAPASVFHLTDANGNAWTAHVTFTADDGTTVPTVSAAIWHWFAHPDTTWSAIQRITPASLPEHQRAALDAATLAALDISQSR